MRRTTIKSFVAILLSLFTTACEEPTQIEVLSGEWNFLRRSSTLFLISEVDQYLINPLNDATGSFGIHGDYELDIDQLIYSHQDSLNTNTFFFYGGLPWITTPPQLTIIESEDTITAEFVYYSPSEFDNDIREVYHPESLDFSYLFEDGIFELSMTTFYNDSTSGEVTIGGVIDFQDIQMTALKPETYIQNHSTINSDEIESLTMYESGEICADYYDNYWADTLCGIWSLEGDQLQYSLSNGRQREYIYSMNQDTLILQEPEFCEDEISGGGWIWIAEYPEFISRTCSQNVFYFYR